MRIGALTIGQAPRDDVAPEFLAAAGPGVELIQAGALDGLTRKEIDALAPAEGIWSGFAADGGSHGKVAPVLAVPVDGLAAHTAHVLVSRLLDRSEVLLDEAKILILLQKAIKRLEADGVGLIALFCTGEFPSFEACVPILRPDRILSHFVASVASGPRGAQGSKICAVVPSASQSEEIRAKWQRQGLGVDVEVLSPYTSTPLDVESTALRTLAHRPDMVILDCIGYSRAVKSVFSRVCSVPVILPRTVLGRVTAELVGL